MGIHCASKEITLDLHEDLFSTNIDYMYEWMNEWMVA